MRSTARYPLMLLVILSLSCLRSPRQASAGRQANAATPIRIGRWTARWLHGGLYLDYDQMPLTRGGLVQLFAPNYARGYYGSGAQPPNATITPLPDGGRSYTAQFHYTGEGHGFDATQTIEIHPQNRIVFSIHADWRAADTALLEWNPLRLWAYPLIGSDYAAQPMQGAPVAGRIGYRPLPDSYPATRLSPPWTRLTLHNTAVGDLTLTGAPTPNGPILYDGREDPYLQDEKLFWGGYPALELRPGQRVDLSLTLTVAPRVASVSPAAMPHSAPIALRPNVLSMTDAQISPPPLRDAQGNPVIIPQPKQTTFTGGDFVLSGSIPVTAAPLGVKFKAPLQAELQRFNQALQRDTGVHLSTAHERWSGKGLLIAFDTGLGHNDGAFMMASELIPPISLIRAPGNAEGYSLQVTPNYIALIGGGEEGLFYGLQTLRQLLLRDASGRFRFAGVSITDWPSLSFRGAHIFVGREALPFHKKLIERIFSRYKLNKLVIECEYTAWRSHPEIHVDYSMPPDDLKADVAYARDHFMEPIPLVNSLGHSQWIFANGQHRDIVEDPHVPYAYNVSNPDTYKFLFDIYQEALDIFHPRLFHIGHDEVKIPGTDQFGTYPARPENQTKGITRLFVEDTNRLADWLRPRGARTMLWADMLLHESEGAPLPDAPVLTAANATSVAEAEARRAQLPRDAILADWRYAAGSERRNGLAVLKQAGYDTVGCAWYEPENIRGWAAEAIRNGALGTLQTTWAGYNSNESLLETEYHQFTAFVLAAEYAWSGSALHPDTGNREAGKGKRDGVEAAASLLSYTAENVFARSYRDLNGGGGPQRGWLLLPGSAANIQLHLQAQDRMPLTAFVPHSAVAAGLSSNTAHDADTGLAVPGEPTVGIMLRGALPLQSPADGNARSLLPAAVTLPVRQRARELAFLHAIAYGVPAKTRVGTYTVVYTDGKRIDIPLRSRFEIRALDDRAPFNSFALSAIRIGTEKSLTLWLLQWSNPRPGVAIARLEFRADDPLAAPILFAVTGIQ